MLKASLDVALENENKLSQDWKLGYNALLDAYLGEIPAKFKYQKKEYTPKTFVSDAMGVNPADYIELTSYNHHPYYTEFDLEVPDNWSHDRYYNLPINELISVINNALKTGYSVAWDGDVTEDEFSHKKGIADFEGRNQFNRGAKKRSGRNKGI